jgi:MFS family permease
VQGVVAMSRPVLPSSAAGWWATGLAWSAVVVGVLLPSLTSAFGPLQERLGRRGIPVGSSLVLVEVLLAVLAVLFCLLALRRHDRAWLLIAGFVFVALVGGFWILFTLGEVVSPH